VIGGLYQGHAGLLSCGCRFETGSRKIFYLDENYPVTERIAAGSGRIGTSGAMVTRNLRARLRDLGDMALLSCIVYHGDRIKKRIKYGNGAR
jgi:hypothetical protein